MPWSRSHRESDPLKAKRRQLEEQERLLAEKMSRLTHELQHGPDLPPAEGKKPAPEPPVWRMEDDPAPRRASEPTPARKRNLARQRQRDRLIFFIVFGCLLAVTAIVLWLWKTHVPASE
jgi:hypothetical protein